MKTYTIPEYGIVVQVENGSGRITSELKKQLIDYTEQSSEQYYEASAQADALEALILAHACAGIDITSEAYLTGLKSSLEAIANNSTR